ncbi:MAG: conjugal transfer protein TraF [Elusimicrobia bacterium]|nr:conjugal transfer protein TraF [Elusimicrobiota bacterium]
MKKISTVLTLFVLFAATVMAAERPAVVRGVRPLGMGDAFTAVADDQNVFFYNPAGTTQRTGSLLTLLDLSINIGQDLLDAYDFIDKNESKLKDFNSLSAQDQINLINDMNTTVTKLDPQVRVGVPNSNYLSGPMGNHYHWGIGTFGQVEGSFKINADIPPSLNYDINADAILAFNMAKRWDGVRFLPGKIGAGVNLKYISRSQVNDRYVSFLQLEDFDAPPLQAGKGLGADLGFLYQPNDRWNFGLAAMDLLGTSLDFESIDAKKGFAAKPTRTSVIKTRWNLGTAWTPSKIGISKFAVPTGNRLLLAMDVRDVINSKSKVLFGDTFLPDTAWTHVYLGAEYRWWFLRLRGGANQGYPTYGFGVDIPFLKLDYTFYSDEKGLFAGSLEQANHLVSIAFRFGTGKTAARARIGVKDDTAPAKETMVMPAATVPAVDVTAPAEASQVAPDVVPVPVQEAPATSPETNP